MSEIKRIGDLDIGQDLEFQKRSWAVQRAGWVVMTLLIIAGLLGVFGRGIAADATAGEENSGLRVEYERFARAQSPTTLVMRLGAGANSVRLNREYLEAVQIESVSPPPETVEAAPGDDIYVFSRAADGAGEPFTVTFYLQPKGAAVISGRASANNVTREFRQFVYP